MSQVAICTDSTALFPGDHGAPAGVTVVPIGIFLDGEAYGLDDPDDFYARLSAGGKATTSTPSPGALLDAYESVADAGVGEILSIHLDARTSATVAAAELAARVAPIPVTVVDSGTVSFGLGLCVSAASRAIADGASVVSAAQTARRLGRSLKSLFVAPAAPRGRVPTDTNWAMLTFADGVTRPVEACHSPKDAAERMAARILSTTGTGGAAVGHASTHVKPWADELAELLGGDPELGLVLRYRLSEPVGAHTGPLCFGAFWWLSQETGIAELA